MSYLAAAVLAVALALLPTVAEARRPTWMASGKAEKTLEAMFDERTGVIRSIPIASQESATTASPDTCEVQVVNNQLVTSCNTGQAQTISGGSGGSVTTKMEQPAELTEAGALCRMVTKDGCLAAQTVEDSSGNLTSKGTVTARRFIANGAPNYLEGRKYDAAKTGDANTCGTIASKAGRGAVLFGADTTSLCHNGSPAVHGVVDFSFSDASITAAQCVAPGDGGASAGSCGGDGMEYRTGAKIVFSKLCGALRQALADGESYDADLLVDNVEVATVGFGGAAMNAEGESACQDISVTVSPGTKVQVQLNTNATSCVTGTGCAVPAGHAANIQAFF